MSVVRPGTDDDVARAAELHTARITEGFLPTLGPRFLRRLYRRIVRSPDAFLLVAVDDGAVVGFVAGATDVGRLYRAFLVRDSVVAGAVAAPRLVRSAPRVLETLRYPATAGELPPAEILAVAVDESCTGRGIGAALVAEATAELRRRGVDAAKVVAGADNAPALRLYEAAGFAPHHRIAVHRDTPSEVLVWSSSSP
jgi:ribosomal protein S18 acetylase RimI-like enzyme